MTTTQRPNFRTHLKNNETNEMSNTNDTVISPWQAITGLILAILSIYFVWVPGLNFILALLALFFGIRGLRSHEKAASITAIIVSAINIFGSLIVIGLVMLLSYFLGWWPHSKTNYQPSDYYRETYPVQKRTQQEVPTIHSLDTESSYDFDTSNYRQDGTRASKRRRSKSSNDFESSDIITNEELMRFLEQTPSNEILMDANEYVVPLQAPIH